MSIQRDTIINNRYAAVQKLGQGGMGTVFSAQDRLTQQEVAVKLLNVPAEDLRFASKMGDSNPKLALINEFRIMAGLRHPHIVSVYDYGLHDDIPYIVMEYIRGTVSIEIALEQTDNAGKVRLLLQVLEALSYLHRRNVIHRDLKPSNILVDDGDVKVLDFGLSVANEMATGRAGTLAYMSPETLNKGITLPQSDLYAFGVLAYEAFAGESPYFGNPIVGILHAVPDITPIEDHPVAGIIERLLLKDPLDRYQQASDVITAIETAYDLPHRETVSVRESFLQASAFVGREAEISQLMTSLEQTKAQTGSAWLVGGESGVGKSRLFDEFRIRALTAGACVLRGQGVDGGGLPFQLWRNITRHLLLSTDVSDFEASVLKEYVPDIEDLIGRPVSPAPFLQGEGQKIRLISTIVDLLKRQIQPTVLLLEDLQWTEESLDVLRKLLYFIKQLPVLVVGNYRNDERAGLPDELPGTNVIQLERLSNTAISELLEAMLGEPGKNPHLISFLQEQTEGNAFFMVEVMRALAEDAGQLSDIGRQTLPDEVFTGGIENIIQKRIETVPEQYHELLYLSAIAGRYLDINIMHHLATVSGTKLDDMLLACASAHVLDVVDDNWQFSHDKLRDGSLRSIPQARVIGLHSTVAQAYEAVYPDNEDYASILIDLWRKADNPAKECHYLLIEGKRLNEKAGLKNCLEAEKHFKRADNLLSILDLSDAIRLDVALGLGIAQIGSHQMDKAGENFETAIELAEKLDDKPKLAQAMVGLARSNIGSLSQDEIYDLMNKAVDIAYDGGDRKMIAASRSVQGYIYANYNDLDNALESFFAARDALMVEFVDYEVAQIINNIGKITQILGNLEEARKHLLESRDLALKSGHYNNAILSTSNLGTVEFFSEDYASASDYFAESIKLMQQSGDIAGLSHVWILKSFADAELDEQAVIYADFREAIQARTDGTRDYSNMYIVMGAVRLSLLLDKPQQAGKWLGLAEKLGNENPFVREWLDPLQDKLKNALDDATRLPELLASGAELDADAVVNEVAQLLLDNEI